ncbi:four-helix bundle copper-binding protein [Actinopolyspora sp. H202]|uniref:four-helix bundle copper-binding protein n=1 Tax=Actinopolyspora sp. H202 TaxID=1500456 RepID=UPI003EE4E520
MPYAKQLLETHPWAGHVDREILSACIEACVECAQACTTCADACLSEEGLQNLRRCVRLDLDCADICEVTGRVLSRQTAYDAPTSKGQLEACRESCATCAKECESHAETHEHCRLCAEACRRCERACEQLLQAMK